jgi:rRNA methylases
MAAPTRPTPARDPGQPGHALCGSPGGGRWRGDHRLARFAGPPLTAAVPAGGLAWHEADLRGESAILLGSEAGGLSGRWQAAADAGRIPMQTISLPMLGVADSLNVSAAAAVLAYESLRQQTAG